MSGLDAYFLGRISFIVMQTKHRSTDSSVVVVVVVVVVVFPALLQFIYRQLTY